MDVYASEWFAWHANFCRQFQTHCCHICNCCYHGTSCAGGFSTSDYSAPHMTRSPVHSEPHMTRSPVHSEPHMTRSAGHLSPHMTGSPVHSAPSCSPVSPAHPAMASSSEPHPVPDVNKSSSGDSSDDESSEQLHAGFLRHILQSEMHRQRRDRERATRASMTKAAASTTALALPGTGGDLGQVRLEEMRRLYGEAADEVTHMEQMAQMRYDGLVEGQDVGYWPNIPICMVFD